MKNIKYFFNSSLFKISLSLILVYFAFNRVDVVSIFKEIKTVPITFVIAILLFNFLVSFISGYRWALLVIKKISFEDLCHFVITGYIGSFYALFFPSSIGGDLVKWTRLSSRYPSVSKKRWLSSVVLDRLVGLSALSLVSIISILLLKSMHLVVQNIFIIISMSFFCCVLLVFILIFVADFKKILQKMKIPIKIINIIDLFKEENKINLIKAFILAFINHWLWMLPIWFYSLNFGAGFSLMSVYAFVPLIYFILALPISFAGFGAREALFLYFFSQTGSSETKILLVSSFAGIVGVVNALLGGFINLFL